MSEQSTGGMPDLVGQTVGQYEIIRKLGAGGMATVYLGRQQSIGRTVAIKVLPPHFMHDPTFMQRFESEVRIAADLQHPRVLPVYDYGQVQGRPFIVMAYMAGGTLSDRIREGSMPLDEIVRLVTQIAEGLDHAHAKGVVHRDFKPSNVLLDENGNAHLADFGISKISESTINLTGSGVVGTPAYMAPEMGREGIVAPSVDVYALGVTLYQMLTGAYPYGGETPLSVMMAHVNAPIPDVRSVRPDLPESVARVLLHALAKRPEERYQSAGELAAALREAARETGLDVASTPTRADARPVPRTPPPGPPTPPEQMPTQTPPPMEPGGWQSAPGAPGAPARPATPAPEPPGSKKGGLPWGLLAGLGAALVLAVVGCIAVFFIFDGLSLFAPATQAVVNPVATEPITAVTEAAVATQEIVVTEDVLPPGDGGAGTTFTIENQSSYTVCHVLLAPSDSDSWGDEQLGPDTPISPGSSFSLTDVPAGLYDYQALDCEQNILDEHYGVELSSSAYTWTIRDANDTLTLYNDSSYQICAVYVSSAQDSYWGSNRLFEGEAIPSGAETFFYLPSGTYDMYAESCDTNIYWEQYEQLIDGGYEWTLTD